MHQTTGCQARNIGNIGISETPAQFQHSADPLQENIAALDRQGVSRVHDGLKLEISQGNHDRIMPQWRRSSKAV